MAWTSLGSLAAISFNLCVFGVLNATSTLTFTVVGMFKQARSPSPLAQTLTTPQPQPANPKPRCARAYPRV